MERTSSSFRKMKNSEKLKGKSLSLFSALLLLFAIWLGVKLALVFMLWVTVVN